MIVLFLKGCTSNVTITYSFIIGNLILNPFNGNSGGCRFAHDQIKRQIQRCHGNHKRNIKINSNYVLTGRSVWNCSVEKLSSEWRNAQTNENYYKEVKLMNKIKVLCIMYNN